LTFKKRACDPAYVGAFCKPALLSGYPKKPRIDGSEAKSGINGVLDMQKYRFLALFLMMFTVLAAECLGACHAVGPAAAGNGSGSSWTNRMVLPSTLTRGDTYYLTDGTYAAYTFATPNSGTTRITIKKAQSYDYGRAADGCSNDISAGWNAATMGSGQAVFPELFGSTNTPQPGYVTWDGNGTSTGIGCGTAPSQNKSASDCGLRISINAIGQDSGFDIGANNNDGNHRSPGWTFRYFEWQGGGDANNGAQSEELIRCRGGCDNALVQNSWMHDSGCDFFKIPWTTGFTVQNTYMRQNASSSTCHGQLFYSEVTPTNVDFHSNIIQDIQGTGLWVCLTGCQASNWNIYNNVIWMPTGDTRPGTSNGIFACINSGNRCTNLNFIGNTVINYTADYSGAFGTYCDGNPDTITWENNLFYLVHPADRINFQVCGGTIAHNHNSYLSSGTPLCCTTGTDVIVTSGSPNPFVDWTNVNFNLASQNNNWSNGVALAAPFNVDALGNPRPGPDGVWNRGAYEYTSGAPAPPTNLTTVVH
jgi:hypothetical protein